MFWISLSGGIRDLQKDLGASDNSKLSDFLESLRESERRIEVAEANTQDLPKVERPNGVPASLTEYSRLMYDLQLLAFQTDTTRVATFMSIRELSSRTYPELGAPGSHHSISHHRDNPELIAQLHRINHFHMEQFAYYLERLQATEDGDGTLLDHVLIMKGSGMGNSNMHDPTNLPILLAGGAGGRIKGGRHLNFKGTPVANLYVKLLNTIDIPTETVGNSTGQLDI